MKKNKKLLMSFLAINALIPSYLQGAQESLSPKYNRIYNKITKNIEQGKANDDSYRLLEKILKQRTNELKDLYLQSDYIVKPEYLEWQIFLNSYYTERSRGDNTLENARYYSVSTTYSGKKKYNQNAYNDMESALRAAGILTESQLSAIMAGHYNTINYLSVDEQKIIRSILYEKLPYVTQTDGFRIYKGPQQPKEIDLGINIIPKVIDRQPLNPNPTLPQEPSMNVPVFAPAAPTAPAVPSLTIKTFNPVSPNVDEPTLGAAPDFNIKLGSFCNYMNPNCELRGTDGGPYGGMASNAVSYESSGVFDIVAGTPSHFSAPTSLTPGNPAIRHAWLTTATFNAALLKVYFDYGSSIISNSVATLKENLTIDSISNPTIRSDASLAAFNRQEFLVGGSRIATLDNVIDGALINQAVVNLVGPLVVGFEVQSDTNWSSQGFGSQGVRRLSNEGTITDEAETTSAELNGVLGLNSSTTIDLAPFAGGTSITVNRDGSGYTGYKVGIILTYENPDNISTHNYILRNEATGKIKFNSEKSVGIQVYAPQSLNTNVTVGNAVGGEISMGGIESYGLKLSSRISSTSTFTNDGTINVSGSTSAASGSRSSGIGVIEDPTLTGGSSVRGYTGVVKNAATGVINVSGGKGNTGVFLKVAAADDIANDGIINVTGEKNSAMRVDNGEVATDISGSPRVINTALGRININAGENFGAIAADGNAAGRAEAVNNGTIMIENKGLPGTFIENTVGMVSIKASGLATRGGYIENNGTIQMLNDVKTSQGMAVLSNSEGLNTGNIIINSSSLGESSVGVYNEGKFEMTGGLVDVASPKGIGVYAKNNSAITSINGGTIRVSNGAIGLYADDKGNLGNGATINLANSAKIEVNSGGLMMYNYSGTSGNPVGKFDVTGVINTDVNADGTAFYFKGVPSGINAFLTNMVVGSGKLNIKLTSSDSSLFVLDNPGSNINLSDTTSIGIIGSLPSTVTIDPSSVSDYKPYSVFKGGLNVDLNVNVDDPNDPYNRSEFLSSKVTLLSGKTIAGAGAGKYGIGQESFLGSTSRNDIIITVDNGAAINMTGTGSAGVISNYGTVINNGGISATGLNSIGIVAYNGTLAQNNNTIKIGEGGTGIYGENNRNSSYGNGFIEIENNGLITTTAAFGGTSYGIYANNTETSFTRADSQIRLLAGSEINMTPQDGGVGVSAVKSTLTSNGNITVGKNGIAVYADNSEININNGNINLNGDNAIGFYLTNGSAFNGNSGTININGQNIVLFNILNSSFTNNLVINAAPGSTYVVGNLSNATYTHLGTNSLYSDSVFLNGTNSAILIDSSAAINSSGTGSVAVSVDGQYMSPFTPPYTVEGENSGTIALGDSSAAIYGKNGARLKNSGIISLGSNSVGLYSTGTGSDLNNTGYIGLGNSSVGLYQKNGVNIINNNTINGSGTGAIGMYMDTNTGLTVNNGLIELSGDRSIGMYATGGTQNIINNGTIKVHDSSSMDDPSIGIYTKNPSDTIVNSSTGIIEAGKKSLGIYSLGPQVDHMGILKVGDEGTGIYKDTGLLRIHTGSVVQIGNKEAVGLYGINGSNISIDAGVTFNMGSGSYGAIAESGSSLSNSSAVTLSDSNIFVYGNGASVITNNGNINMTGSDNTAFYMIKAGSLFNNADITGTAGTGNIAMYNRGNYAVEIQQLDGTMKLEGLITEGYIENNADITLGDSFLVTNSHNVKTGYSVGIYAEGSSAVNNYGKVITVGKEGVGMYARDAVTPSYNYGTITGTGDKIIGMFADNTRAENHGLIKLTGDEVVGMAGRNGAYIYNAPTGIIEVTGKNVTGIYLAGADTKVENKGKIIIKNTGDPIEDVGMGMKYASSFDEDNIIGGVGDISGNGYIEQGYTTAAYKLPELPSLINSGEITIELGNKFSYENMKVIVKLDPTTNEATTSFSDTIGFAGTTIPGKLEIAPDFSQGTSADRYTFKNIFRGMDGTGEYISQSLTWDATGQGMDIVMTRIPYMDFTNGFWYEDFSSILNDKYANQTGDALKIYDKLDMIQSEPHFRHAMASLAGNVYANINQREEDMAGILEETLHTLQNSSNNTKENMKVSIIGVKGKTEEDTDGVVPYKYNSTGVLALREVERTYRHTFGYSLGYLHTGFEFEDHNNSEEWVDTIQLGLHNKYSVQGWNLRNDLTGRLNFHNIDRNIDWPDQSKGIERSEMNGTYETYSITSDNILGKELNIGKKTSIMPYGAFKAMYVTRPTFSESGLEALQIEGNDAWSAKPRAGVELKTTMPLGSKTAWQLKGTLDFAYEYELADLNEREKARLISIEDGYHKLSKPEDEKGTFRTRAALGIEVVDRYGIFLTGEYNTGNNSQDGYRAGVILKAVF
jgi:hypothetical protein